MELTPKSYPKSSPHYTPNFRQTSTTHSTTYPTPPQSLAEPEVLSAHPPAVAGLGIFNCGVDSPAPHLSTCGPSQPLLPSSQCWALDDTGSNCFSDPSPNLSEYSGIGMYGGFDTLSGPGNSPFITQSSHAEPLATLPLLSPHQQSAKVRNPGIQTTPMAGNYSLDLRRAPVSQQWHRISKQSYPEVSGAQPMAPHSLKRSYPYDDEPSYHSYQLPVSSAPTASNRNTSGMPSGLTPPLEFTRSPTRTERRPSRPSNLEKPVQSARSSPAIQHGGQAKKRKTTQYPTPHQCTECGLSFSRSSNCKSHMNTHDPNRKLPHKCTFEHCTKRFSRKTDLARHIDSVHKKLRKFACEACGHRFARQDTLRRHREDGCRKHNRQAYRSGKDNAPTTHPSTNTSDTNPPTSIPPNGPGPTFRNTNTNPQTQIYPPFFGAPFSDAGSDVYSHFSAC